MKNYLVIACGEELGAVILVVVVYNGHNTYLNLSKTLIKVIQI